jgi:hypothetical protein
MWSNNIQDVLFDVDGKTSYNDVWSMMMRGRCEYHAHVHDVVMHRTCACKSKWHEQAES